MRPSLPRLAAIALAALVAACGGGSKSPPGIPANTWTWISTPGAVCSDGSPTGIAVETPSSPSGDVLVFLMGGGACWDALTCFTANIATPGPYGEAQMNAQVPTLVPGSVFDRTVASNPYKDFTFVFVPYCTGDVHTGDRLQRYAGAPRDWYHKGRVNLAADFAWMKANLDPAKVVVSGASAGGFGSLLAFDLAKTAWPSAQAYLVDDSGPPLREIPQLTIDAWYLAWDLGGALTPLCGDACRSDMSLVFPALQAKYPDDRFALLSSTQDATIRGFFGTFTTVYPFVVSMDATTFETGLRALAGRIEDATPPGETHAFVVTGTSHTMLGHPADFTSPQGATLFEWLGQQVNDDPAWAAAIPP